MNSFRGAVLVAALTVLSLFAGPVRAEDPAQPPAADLVDDGQLIDIHSERYQGLFEELRLSHDFTQAQLAELFGGVTIKKRVLELMDTQWEAKPYYEYVPRFITTAVVREGQWQMEKHRELLDQVEKRFGVERQIVVAIWGIESRFGRNEGAFGMFQTLNTLFDAYPRRRSFYRGQLIDFLVLCRDNGINPLAVTGSYGGAFGQTQFIPSSFLQYAVDFDNDGKRDVWNSTPDVLASIANYLQKFGWKLKDPVYVDIGTELRSRELFEAFRQGRKGFVARAAIEAAQGMRLPPVEKDDRLTIVGLETDPQGGMRFVAGYPNLQAITAWNNSNRYAMAVSELAERFVGNTRSPL